MKDGQKFAPLGEALKDGQKFAPLGEALREVIEGQTTVFDIARHAGIGDEPGKLTVTLGHKPIVPDRLESPARDHYFNTPAGLVAYLNKYKTKDTVVFVDAGEDLTISAVIDEKASHGFEVVRFVAERHPRMLNWTGMTSKGPLGIRTFALVVARHRGDLADPEGKGLETALAFRQVRLSQQVDAAFGGGKEATNGVMVKHKVTGQVNSEMVELPDQIDLHLPLFVGDEPRALRMDCLYGVKDTQVHVDVAFPTYDETIRKAFQAMAASVQKDLADGVLVVDGRPAYLDWLYLKT